MKAFLSHTSSDKDLVGLVQKKLTQANAWYDAVDIENGESIPEKINDGLRNATHYVLFWSEKASKSPWVHAELNAAFIRMLQLLENLYKKHQVAGRTIIANKFLDDMLNAKKEFREKYGADTLIEQDFLPDS